MPDMKLKSSLIFLLTLICSALVIPGVAGAKEKKSKKLMPPPVYLRMSEDGQRARFVNLDKGVRLNVKDNRRYTGLVRKFDPNPLFSQIKDNGEANTAVSRQDMADFVDESMRGYMRDLGFRINSDLNTDYIMDVTVQEYGIGYYSGLGWSGVVRLGVEMYNADNKLVYPQVECVGKFTSNVSPQDESAPTMVLDNAFCRALADVDWERIASFLKKSAPAAAAPAQATAAAAQESLSDVIIRWYIISKPQGADLSWRVVSSTPDVKNTNTNFIGNTPYESTESFDIKGLTMDNAGSVQIEVTCEKEGYLPQRKRFNLRQAIDQKEISAKFNLVKEDAE